jgi:Protein kinase domain
MTRFVVAERIGVGGMGEVFAARQEGASGFARPVALKKLARSLSADREFAELFMAEARLASQLNHPNIVSVYAFDRDEDGALFLAMELVDGMDLRWLVLALRERNLRMDVALAGFIAGEILKALDHAHELRVDGRPLGLVHRIYLGADSPIAGVESKSLRSIHCSMAELWRRAGNDRRQLANLVLFTQDHLGTWIIKSGAQIRTIHDDCGTTVGSVHP